MRRYTRLFLTGTGMGILVIIAIALLSDVEKIAGYATAFPWLILIPVLCLRMTNWALRFVKWHFYLWLIGVRHISPTDSASLFLAGFPMALSPGKAAEMLKSFILYNMTGTPVARSIPVVASERLSDGMAVLLLIAIAAISLNAAQFWPVVIVFMSLLLTLILIMQRRVLCLRVLTLLGRLPLIGRFARHFALIYESSYQIAQWQNVLVAVTLGMAANLLDGVGIFLILSGLGFTPTLELFFQAQLVTSLAVVTGALSGMPGGFGVADLTITGTLQTLVGLGVAQAGFATLLIRFVELWFGVIAGICVIILRRRRLFPPGLDKVIKDHQAHKTDKPDLVSFTGRAGLPVAE